MKKIILGLLFIISTSVINAQKTITYEEMKTISKGMFENIECDVYVGKDGHSYKVKDTLKIGRPSTNKTFAFIVSRAQMMSAAAPQKNVDVSISGSNTIIKKIYVYGTKRTGFKMHIIGKGECLLCDPYEIDFEEAIATGEIQSFGMTREQAIAKLKEAKDLVDLGLMSKEDFEKLKEELSKIILQK
jgi:hypothetical protein